MGRTDKEIYRVIDNVNSYYRINSESKKELLLNKYPNAAAAYSLRLLDGYYRGPLVRVRRDDGNEVDVYPDYNNELSLDSLVSIVDTGANTTENPLEPPLNPDPTFTLSLQSLGEFVHDPAYDSSEPVSAYVCVWYDQSKGNDFESANNASQNVATSQPLIVSSGVIVEENGKPAVNPQSLNGMPTGVNGLTDLTVFAIGNNTFNGTQNFPRMISSYAGTGPLGANSMILRYNSSTSEFQFRTSSGVASISGSQPQNFLAVIRKTSNTIDIGLNGSVYSSTTSTAALTDQIYLLEDAGGTQMEACRGINEIIIYNSSQSDANRTGIEEDINDFYQIDGYTPTPKLIDLTQDLAVQNGGTTADGTPAAAYSLRLLSSTYNGPLVRIRRTIDNTEVDVYPDSDGEFSIYSTIEDGGTELTTGVTGGSTDKTTLHEFLYGQDTDCTVVRWYDQASGNHATQDVATNQPKIYDSVTGVVTENGKPALDFANASQQYLLSGNVSFADTDLTAVAVAKAINSPAGVWALMYKFKESGILFRRQDTGSGGILFLNTLNHESGQGFSDDITGQSLHFTNHASNTFKHFLNGSEVVSAADTFNINNQPIYIGTGVPPVTTRYLTGTYQELIFWNDAHSSNRTGIEKNINEYYRIY